MAVPLPPDERNERGIDIETNTRKAAGLRQAASALRHRRYALFWMSGLVTNSGTWIQSITVPYVLFRVTHNPGWIGLATVAQFVPAMITTPIGGSLADRFDRRLLIILSQTFMGAMALLLWLAWLTGHASPAVMLVLLAAGGFANGINVPSWQSTVASLVPREDLFNAVTLNSVQTNASRAIGPAIGGLLLSTYGPGGAFLANTLSFLVPIAVLVWIRATTPRSLRNRRSGSAGASGGSMSDFGQSLRYVARNRGILLSICLLGVAAGVSGPAVVLLPIYAVDVFHVGAGTYGLLTAAFGVGAIVAAVALGGFGGLTTRPTLIKSSFFAFGVGAIGLALSGSLVAGAFFLVLMGGAYLVTTATLATSVQLLVDDAMRGRVLSVYIVVYQGSAPLGALIATTLSGLLSVRAATGILAGATLVAAVVCIVGSETMADLEQRVERLPDRQATTATTEGSIDPVG